MRVSLSRPLALAGALLTVAATRPAEACDCARPPEPFDALVEADAVFEAQLMAKAYATDGNEVWRIKTLRTWKGTTTKDDSPLYNDMWCGAALRAGERYLFYTYEGEQGGVRNTSRCNRIVAAADMAGDLAELGPAKDVRDPAQGLPPMPSATAKPATSMMPVPTRSCWLNCAQPGQANPRWPLSCTLLLLLAGLRRHSGPARHRRQAARDEGPAS